MSLPPELPLRPEDVGDELTGEQLPLLAQSFVVLVLYVEAQYRKCGTPVPDDGG